MGDRSQELQLVERARAGDRHAMSELYRMYDRRVFSVARRLTGDDDTAQDVAQDAWIRAFQKIELFRGDASFGTWVYRIATNAALNRLRSVSRRSDAESAAEWRTRGASIDDAVLNQRLLQEALDRLPEGYRTVLVLHDVEGMKHDEIADMLGVTVGTSKSQLHKARARMREMLAPTEMKTEAGNDV
jgi:RNA polymerase sigma-70 factor (ECF subfamily)